MIPNNRVLVTAFEPFNGNDRNPSAEVLNALSNQYQKLLLPTSYQRAAALLIEKINELSPELVICMGLAGGRREITPEFAALNIKDADMADNDGESASGESVIPGAPNAYFTDLQLGEAARAVREQGIPCRVSYHAGTYVCNSTYYNLLHHGVKGCFVHVPHDEITVKSCQTETAYIPLCESVRAVEILLTMFRSMH